jgi:hypothetical protein
LDRYGSASSGNCLLASRTFIDRRFNLVTLAFGTLTRLVLIIVRIEPHMDTLAMKAATITSPAVLIARGMSFVATMTAALDSVSPKMRNPE